MIVDVIEMEISDLQLPRREHDKLAFAVHGLMGKAMEMEPPDAKQMKALASLLELIQEYRAAKA